VPDAGVAPTAATVYGAYLKDELARQDTRQASFEQRGIAVVTTAGALVTLLFGLAAFSTATANGTPLTHEEKVWLAVALGLFFVAALFALITNWPIKYAGPVMPDVVALLEATDENTVADAEHAVANVRAKIVTDAQKKNTRKSRLLIAALAFEVAAVACVAVAIVEVISP
jgi:hypothetical protein